MAPITTRRELLKAGGAMAVASALGDRGLLGQDDERKIRVGFIGVGSRGSGLLDIALHMPGIEVPAVCDIQKPHLDRAIDMVEKAGQKRPEGYGKDEYDYKRLIDRDDLDAVIIATYWEWHTPMAVYAMKTGKYAGVEVPWASPWTTVAAGEDPGADQGPLHDAGELELPPRQPGRAEHDPRRALRRDRPLPLRPLARLHRHLVLRQGREPRWGGEYLFKRNADQYPTHSLGPVLSWMDINCGDAFDTLVSMATRSLGINDHFGRKFGPDHPMAKRKVMQGDIVTTMVKTKKGNTIVINNDMQTPRPYDNRWQIQGTRGLYNEQRWSVFMDGEVPKGNDAHKWEPLQPYEQKYEHRLYKGLGDPEQRKARGVFGHGEPDYLELQEFFRAVRNKTATPIDIYDSVTMSVVIPLSEESLAKGSMPVKCPDFTKGQWKTRKPYFALDSGV